MLKFSSFLRSVIVIGQVPRGVKACFIAVSLSTSSFRSRLLRLLYSLLGLFHFPRRHFGFLLRNGVEREAVTAFSESRNPAAAAYPAVQILRASVLAEVA